MNGSQRRREILKLVQDIGKVSARDLAARFGVSRMTAHRDLDDLERRGLVRRFFGGAVPATEQPPALAGGAPPAGPAAGADPEERCAVCLRAVVPNLRYWLALEDGSQRVACCPHCGVSIHLVLGPQVLQATTTDTLSGRVCSAEHASYLLGSAAAPCCQPSILTFAAEADARRFQKGFGGKLGTLSDALGFLRDVMRGDAAGAGCPHCAGRGV